MSEKASREKLGSRKCLSQKTEGSSNTDGLTLSNGKNVISNTKTNSTQSNHTNSTLDNIQKTKESLFQCPTGQVNIDDRCYYCNEKVNGCIECKENKNLTGSVQCTKCKVNFDLDSTGVTCKSGVEECNKVRG